MPPKFSPELKARAVELVLHAQADPATGATRRVADELGLNSETLRSWVAQHKRSGATTPAGKTRTAPPRDHAKRGGPEKTPSASSR